jgi:hypothetical protein
VTPAVLLIVPRAAADVIRAGGSWGEFTVRVSDPQNVGAIVAVRNGNGPMMPTALSPPNHFLASADPWPVGRWYRVPPEVHGHWLATKMRAGAALATRVLREVANGFYAGPHVAVTYAPDVADTFGDAPVPDMVAWHVDTDGITPISVEVEPTVLGQSQLEPAWPVADLASATMLVVGTGSIGAVAAMALATFGVGRLRLLDPDRLLWHNLVRHAAPPRDVGKLKVAALAEQINALRPDTVVDARPLNVITDADRVRPLLHDCDVVVCTADGVAPRRVISHLARRAAVPAILACVLEDGGLGEILRLQPWRSNGCLLCQREALKALGGLDPEPALDLGYGTGSRHRPMTAVGGDLHLIGQFAAKVAVATHLERHGHPDQRLPGESALVALRPRPGWAPPFDLTACGEVRWAAAAPPLPECPTCGPA